MLIPDWSIPKELFLVWPGGIANRNHLVPFYVNFIKHIPETVGISLIISNRELRNDINKILIENDINRAISFVEIPFINGGKAYDIWIRDWSPLCAVDDSGKSIYLKAKYSPAYLDSDEADPSDNAGKMLAGLSNDENIRFPLVWDLGNITHNGNGMAIVTNRIIADNEGFSKKGIQELFYQMLGINKLMFIDEEPGDATGHVDGLIRFIGEDKLVVSRYPEICIEENKYIDGVKKQIQMESDNALEFIDIPNGLFIDESSEGVPSSFGNHINYFHLGSSILIPIYGIDSDDIALSAFKKALPHTKIVPIESSALSHKGGVLNCITWVTYDPYLPLFTRMKRLEECIVCDYHISYNPGHVLCDYKLVYIQRMTGYNSDGTEVVIACPLVKPVSEH